jgi:dihydroxyacetone kinase phosphotransfer subunit
MFGAGPEVEATGGAVSVVGVVLVSHSRDLAQGLASVAAQMAPNVRIAPAGGTDDGGIGTSFERITAAIAQADSGDGAVVLYDLGSGYLTAATAVEFLDSDQQQRVIIVDAPFVEGAVSAAIAAQIGGDLRAVIAAALEARTANGPGGVREPG